MKIIDGENAVLGRLAGFAAKESLKGEEIVILNCNKVIITGNRKNIEEDFKLKRKRVGSGQRGPKVSRLPYLIIKRAIRGMLPEHRSGRGKEALRRIKCYDGVPKEFEESNKFLFRKDKKIKFILVEDLKK